jgi:phage terminase small subunit
MTTLTPKQEHFAQCIADGMTQADAYRAAFNVKPSTKPESVYQRASALMADVKISSRVAELKGALAKKALWTREMSVKALIQAYREGKPSEKVSAVKELNAMHGFNAPSKMEVTNPDGSLKPQVIQIIAKQ